MQRAAARPSENRGFSSNVVRHAACDGGPVPNSGSRWFAKYWLLLSAQLLAVLVFVLLSRAESGRRQGRVTCPVQRLARLAN